MYRNSEEKNVVINPNTTGYIDRKMAKWQGLILSEHTETLIEETKSNRKINPEKEKQTSEYIYQLIDYSFSQKVTISIQLDCLFNGKFADNIVGIICGFFENNVYIQTLDSQVIVCDLDLIRNVEKYDISKWFIV